MKKRIKNKIIRRGWTLSNVLFDAFLEANDLRGMSNFCNEVKKGRKILRNSIERQQAIIDTLL